VLLERGLRVCHPGAAGEVAEDALVRTHDRLLRQVAGRERGGVALDGAGVGCLEAREQLEERGLADAVRPHDAEPAVWADGELDVREDGVGAESFRDACERDSHV
jgi:hypothetical protein